MADKIEQKESVKLEEQQVEKSEVTESTKETVEVSEVKEDVKEDIKEVKSSDDSTKDATSKKDDTDEKTSKSEVSENNSESKPVVSESSAEEESLNKLEEANVTKDEFLELRKDVRDIGIRKEWLFEVRSIVSKEIKSLFAMLKDLKESRDVLTTQVQSLKDEREVINVDIKSAISDIKAVQGPKDTNKVNVKKLKHELDKLQYHIETTPLSPDEEKKVMRQIKEREKMIAKAGPEVAPVTGDAKELSTKINGLKDKSNEIHDKVQANAVESQVKHEAMISVSKEIKFLKAREKEIHSLFVETKSTYKEKRRTFMQNRKFFSQPGSSKKRAPRKVSEKEAMKKVEENIQEKIKLGKKITTEDLLSFGR